MTRWAGARVVFVVAAAALAGCSGEAERAPGAASPAEPSPTPRSVVGETAALPTAAAALKVNGMRRATVSSGVPVLVSAVVRQSASAPERSPAAEPPSPVIVGVDGAPISIGLRYLGTDAASLAPGANLTFRWAAETELAPGDYTVEWNPVGLFSVASPEPRVRPARVRAIDQPGEATEMLLAELALLQAASDAAAILGRVDGLLAEDPGNLLAHRVRAQALEQLDRPDEAAAAWLDLLGRLRDRAEVEAPGSEPEIAFWINARVGELRRGSVR